MESDIEIDFEVCRACGKSNAPHIPIELHEKKFILCTAISISPNDGLPNRICEKCLKRLTISYHFKINCQRIDTQLRALKDSMIQTIQRSEIDNSLQSIKNSTQLKCELIFPESNEESLDETNEYKLNEFQLSNTVYSETFENEEYLTNQTPQQTHIHAQANMESLVVEQPFGSENLPAKLEALVEHTYKQQIISEELMTNDDNLYLDGTLSTKSSDGLSQNNGDALSMVVFKSPHNSHNIGSNASNCRGKVPKPATAEKFRCDDCCKEFSSKTNLLRHQAAHDGKKPFRCDICSKGFTQSGSLKIHRNVHFNIKPYVCSVCSRRFTQAKSLKFHMRRHTGEKPYTCGICFTSFRQKCGLARHRQFHQDK